MTQINKINLQFQKNKFILNIVILFSFIIFSIISVSLLLKTNTVYQGLDTQFHFKRIMELNYSIRNGQLLPNYSFNEFHGSAVMGFYPYIILLPSVFLSFIIKSKVALVYIIFIFNTFLSLMISFFSSRNYTKSYSTSYLFAVMYSLSNIFLSYNLIITDFGIAYSFIFLPLIIFGFLKTIQKEKNGWIELSIGMTLLAFSHILNIFIISFLLLLWLILNFKNMNEDIILKLFKSVLLFLILSSVIWMPILELYIHNFNNISMPFLSPLTRINIKEFMSGIYGGKTGSTIGFFPIISMFVSIFFYNKFDKYIKQMYLLSLFIILAALFFPWQLITSYRPFGFLNQIQGIYRFLIVPQMLLCFILAIVVSDYIISKNKRIVVYTMIIIITIALQIIVGQYAFAHRFSNNLLVDNYLKNNDNTIYTRKVPGYKFNDSSQFYNLMNSYQNTNDDYIPKHSVKISSYVHKNLGVYNNKHLIKINHIGYNNFKFNGENNIYNISLPLYVYNNEKLNVYLNNRPVKYYANKDGLLTVDNIKNHVEKNNKIYIKPNIDKIKIMSVFLTLFGWLIVLIILIKRLMF